MLYAMRFASIVRAFENRYRAMAIVDEGIRSHIKPGSGQGTKLTRRTESNVEASFLSKAVDAVTTSVWITTILVAVSNRRSVEGLSRRLSSIVSASHVNDKIQSIKANV